jgi:F-type H+-transporting ATPase subunit epsilon
MPPDRMSLRILLPFEEFLSKVGVASINATTSDGSVGLLPHRQDCVAVLRPGILSFTADGEGESFVAVDQGTLIKAGLTVTISVRRAIGGINLGQLQEAVRHEFLTEAELDKTMRAVMARIETGLLIGLRQLQNE